MTAYLIVDIEIHDQEKFARYEREVSAFLQKYGAERLARGGQEVIEGQWRPKRVSIFRFPDRQSIHDLLNDPLYQPLKAMRHESSTSHLVAIDGLG